MSGSRTTLCALAPIVLLASGPAPAAGVFRARRVLISAGAWVRDFVPAWRLRVERQLMHWFTPPGPGYGPEKFPVFMFEREGVTVYGVPDMGEGLKMGIHHGGQIVEPDQVERSILPADIEAIRSVSGRIRGLEGRLPDESVVCLYTDSQDYDFVIGERPDLPGMFVATGFSGHGFKFAPAVGEALAHLLTGKEPPVDLSLFDPGRVAPQA